jgi:hypothetical protein
MLRLSYLVVLSALVSACDPTGEEPGGPAGSPSGIACPSPGETFTPIVERFGSSVMACTEGVPNQSLSVWTSATCDGPQGTKTGRMCIRNDQNGAVVSYELPCSVQPPASACNVFQR